MQCAYILATILSTKMKNSFKTYSELIQLPTYEQRVQYLQVFGQIGLDTFGSKRYLNQDFYRSKEWKNARRDAIVRDCGCDLAIPGLELYGYILVHHIVPITEDDILEGSDLLFNLDNLVCVSKYTHDLIHYGDGSAIFGVLNERKPNDTSLW